eukprot:Gregarina_sp_Pseudo_9__464@NODE_129_length_4108_cov_11_734824_g121_i0_p1_GENE_NODE_129_length_4108_cov_11_734824_g121_i0NODE_129_length_4108_cov_11_734824_g121_i0_p1_ORF_typecomplete_len472_score120_25_NODE_129_length_4108_cov_11_734824_g121_i016243039
MRGAKRHEARTSSIIVTQLLTSVEEEEDDDGAAGETETAIPRRHTRPTLTDRELSKSLAWRRRQFYNKSPRMCTPGRKARRASPSLLHPETSSEETPSEEEQDESFPSPVTQAAFHPASLTSSKRESPLPKSAHASPRLAKLPLPSPTSAKLPLPSPGLGQLPLPSPKSAAPSSLSSDAFFETSIIELKGENFLPEPTSLFEQQKRRSTYAVEVEGGRRSTFLNIEPSNRSVFLRIKRPVDGSTMIQTLTQGEPIFDTVEIPVIRKWIGPSDMHYAFLKVLPLAAACLLLSLVFVIWGATNIILVRIRGGSVTWEETGDLVVGIFKLLIGLAGILTIGLQLRMGLHFLSVGYNVFLVSHCVSFVTQWLEWGLALGGATTTDHVAWRPSRGERVFMAWSVIQVCLVLLLSFLFIFGLLSSLKMIMAVGGTGWEKQTYLEILERQARVSKSGLHQEFEEENGTSGSQTNYALT